MCHVSAFHCIPVPHPTNILQVHGQDYFYSYLNMFRLHPNFQVLPYLSLTLIASVVSIDKNMQQFFLFTEPYPASQLCNSDFCKSESFDGNIKDLAPLWGPVAHNMVRSWCSATQGMWIFFSEPNFSPTSAYRGFVKTARPSGSSVMQCVNLPRNQGIRSIRHFTHANLSTPAISLFIQDEFGTLQEELFMDGEALSLPDPVTFAAYAFSGFQPWTIFSQVDFQGVRTCLNLPRDYDDQDESEEEDVALLSVGINVKLQLGSARLGCTGDEEVHLYPVNSTTAVLNLGDSLTLFMERGSNLGYVSNQTTNLPPPPENLTAPAFLAQINEMTSSNSKPQLYFSGTELVLPNIYNISNFLSKNFKRNASADDQWELCSDLDFTGICTCTPANSTNITFSEDLVVMSAKFGCSSRSTASASTLQQLYIGLLIEVIITLVLLS